MERREVLVLFMTGAAGCQVEIATPPPGSPTFDSTATETAASTQVATPTGASSRTSEPTPTEESTPAEEPTPTEESTPTSTPTQAERARAEIEAAREALDKVVSTFTATAEAGSDATLLDVNAETEFEADQLDRPLSTATQHIARASDLATAEQKETINHLIRTLSWFEHIVSAQAVTSHTFEAFTRVLRTIEAGDIDNAASAAEEFAPLIPPLRERLERATEVASADDMVVVSGVDEETFTEKNEQFRHTTAAFEFIVEQAESIAEPINQFATATDTYVRSDETLTSKYDLAQEQYRDAEPVLRAMASTFSEPNFSPSVMQERIDAYACSLSAMAEASRDMEVSAQAAEDGDEDTKQTFLNAAQNDLTGCSDTLKRIAGIEELLDA